MPLDTLSALTAAIEDYLERADLSWRIPSFIELAERRIHRRLDIAQNEVFERLDLVAGRAPLPTDYAAWRSVVGPLGRSLDYMTPHLFVGCYGSWHGLSPRLQGDGYDLVADGTGPSAGGVPCAFTVVGSYPLDDVDADPAIWMAGLDQPFLLVGPAASGPITLGYRQGIPPLTEAEPSNATLRRNPDLYLYGALIEAEPFLRNERRLPAWKGLFDEALDDIRALDRAARWGRTRTIASEPTP